MLQVHANGISIRYAYRKSLINGSQRRHAVVHFFAPGVQKGCAVNFPPGRKVYEKANWGIWEIDGHVDKVGPVASFMSAT